MPGSAQGWDALHAMRMHADAKCMELLERVIRSALASQLLRDQGLSKL